MQTTYSKPVFYTISVYHGAFYGWISTSVMYGTRAKAMRKATDFLKANETKKVAVIGHYQGDNFNVEMYRRTKENNAIMKWEKI